jgi:hypothetical protein
MNDLEVRVEEKTLLDRGLVEGFNREIMVLRREWLS